VPYLVDDNTQYNEERENGHEHIGRSFQPGTPDSSHLEKSPNRLREAYIGKRHLRTEPTRQK